MPELKVWLCPVHESLDKSGALKPLDNCVGCLRAERDELRSQNAALQDKLDVLCEPGTPIAIVKAMFDFAIAECGHQRHSSRHAMTTIRETIKALRERNAELEAQRADAFAEYTRCANTPLMHDVLEQRDRALRELAEARSFQINFEHATKIEREEARKDTERLNEQLLNSLVAIMGAIDAGQLVRDISRDSEPGWAMQQLPLVLMLAAAQKAIDAARAAIAADALASGEGLPTDTPEFQGGRD